MLCTIYKPKDTEQGLMAEEKGITRGQNMAVYYFGFFFFFFFFRLDLKESGEGFFHLTIRVTHNEAMSLLCVCSAWTLATTTRWVGP